VRGLAIGGLFLSADDKSDKLAFRPLALLSRGTYADFGRPLVMVLHMCHSVCAAVLDMSYSVGAPVLDMSH
jgi:hypothetical protein